MLAMSGDSYFFLFSFVAMIFAFGLIGSLLSTRGKRRHELDKLRLDVLQQSLQHQAIDQATRTELLRVLQRDHEDARRPWTERLGRLAGALRILWFGVSWALFIVATGMLIAGELRFLRGVYVPMVLPLAIVGFAMVTMPFAWRELTARHNAVADRR